MLPLACPPWNTTGRRIESQVRKALFTYEMQADSIAVALSGGKDSLTLLYMLHAISGRGFPPFKLVAIHVAGEFSCGAGVDKNFLRAICKELDVPFVVQQSKQKREGLNCYSCSRERRKLIFDAAKELGCHTIAFGHHSDDHAQTVLLNLLHKAEFAGNLPKLEMVDFGVTLIRPLIFVNEANVKRFARAYGFERITCMCPVGQNSMRKKVDLLIQELEELFPNARNNIAQAGLVYGSKKAEIR